MTPKQWQKIDQLLDEALELDPKDRIRLLDESCAGDDDLRFEIESLLIASEQSSAFIETPLLPAAASTENDSLAMAGRCFGPYRLLREIGRGGMGVVYLAIRADDEFKKQVAIKLAQPGVRGREVIRRFRRERQILANLDHPNIARLLDGGTNEQGLPYFVMEYVTGIPITEYCDDRGLSITERLKLFRSVCAAVQHAHQNLVIHRDLKPGNILVTAAGEVKLLDFGIAKLLDAKLSSLIADTTTGVPAMTPEYASPEQVRGEIVTTATDVYSLGIVLYELLTGHYPYRFKDRSLPELIRVICEQEPEPPSRAISRIESKSGQNGMPATIVSPETVSRAREGKPEKLRARLRGDLSGIVLMALRKDPLHRYGTVEHLSEDIRRHLDGQVVLARKATLAYRASKFIRRYKMGAAVAAILLLTLFGGILATLRQAGIATQEARDKRRLLYAAQMIQAAQAWDTSNIARLRELVESQVPRDGEEDLRGFEWSYLRRLYHHNGEILRLQHDTEVWIIAYSPDGKTIATGDERGTLNLWDCASGSRIISFTADSKFLWSVVFSQDGKMLATAGGSGTISLWDTTTWRAVATLKGHEGRVSVLAFSGDGKRLASGGDDQTARVWNIPAAQEITTIRARTVKVRALAFSSDGNRLVLQTPGNTALTVWDATTGRKLRSFEGVCGTISQMRFSPDERFVAGGGRDREVTLWDASTGKQLAVFEGHGSEVRSIAFSNDGQLLASGSKDRTIKIWDVVRGVEVKTIKGHEGEIFSVAFSPDGKRLASCGDDFTARVWDVATAIEFSYLRDINLNVMFSPAGIPPVLLLYYTSIARMVDPASGQQLAIFQGHKESITTAAFAPDGKILATGDVAGIVKLWEAESQKEIGSINTQSKNLISMMFSPDGRTLATASEEWKWKLWETRTGNLLREIAGHSAIISAIAFSPCGDILATSSYDHTARLWDANTGREIATLRGHGKPLLSLAFSPDGRLLATGGADSVVKLWDVKTGLEINTFSGHAGHVNALAFSPDGKRLATGGDEGVVRLWDAATGKEVLALSGHTDSVISVAFSPDGNTLVSGGFDCSIRFWRAAPREEAFR